MAEKTEGYSGADLNGVVQKIKQTAFDQQRNYTRELFEECLKETTPSINAETMRNIQEWEAANGLVREEAKKKV